LYPGLLWSPGVCMVLAHMWQGSLKRRLLELPLRLPLLFWCSRCCGS
jgi:hypothetical protein